MYVPSADTVVPGVSTLQSIIIYTAVLVHGGRSTLKCNVNEHLRQYLPALWAAYVTQSKSGLTSTSLFSPPLASLLTPSFFVLSRQCLKMRVLGVDVET